MTYLASIALVALAGVLLIVGLAATSTNVLVAAAFCSGLAVVLLWRRLKLQAMPRSEASYHVEVDLDRPIREPAFEPAVAIDDYNSLLVSEIMPALETLSVDELFAVIVREHRGMNRGPIIDRAANLIDLTLGPGSAARMLTGKH